MFPKNFLYLFWAFADTYFWLIATMIFAMSILFNGLHLSAIDIILFFLIMCYKQSVFYLLYRPIRFIFVPIYIFAYGISLTYTRIHAAITIKDDGWGTREIKEGNKIISVIKKIKNALTASSRM